MKPRDEQWRASVSQSNRAEWRGSIVNADFGQTTPVTDVPYSMQYVEDAKRGVTVARSKHRRLMAIYWTLKAAVIVSGVVVATLAAVGTAGWLVAAFGALATACETAVIAARLQSRAVIAGLLADGMAHEIRRFEMRRGPYASEDRVGILFDAIETLRDSASATRFRLDGEAGETKDGQAPAERQTKHR